MTGRGWAMLLLGVPIAVLCLYLPFVPQTVLPIGVTPVDNQHYRVSASAYGLPMPAGLAAGDRIDAAAMDLRSRFGITTYSVPPAGTPVTLAVDHPAGALPVVVEFARIPPTFLNVLDIALYIGAIWLVAALGWLMLWRGQRLAAAGVGIWCFARLCWEIPVSLPLPLAFAGWADTIGRTIYYSGTLIGLYLLAEDFAWERVRARARRLTWIGYLLLVLLYGVTFLANDVAFHVGGRWLFNPTHVNFRVAAHLLAFAIPIGMLVIRYRKVNAGDRTRIGWVLLSAAAIVAAYLVTGSLVNIAFDDVQDDMLYSAFSAIAIAGFSYAALRHRLVAINLVLNRALVYGLATTVVVAVFGLMESLVEDAALGERASTLVALAVPLALGVVFNRIHQRLDHWIEYLFFHAQYRADAALTQFARECGFITSSTVLLDRAVAEIIRNAKSPAVAVYEHFGDGYGRIRQGGIRDFPLRLDIDDAACVRLRANLVEADLDGLGSALGGDGVAFPVALRGVLAGFLVCAARAGESYSPRERVLLAHVAHEMGASLDALHVNETRSFLVDIARGTLPSSDQTRAAAEQLLRAAPG